MLSMKTAFEMLKTSSISSRWLTPLRMLRTKTALGVDISDKQISLALLKRGKNGVELLTSASAPVPDGAIKNGNIENAAVLAKAIKSLKNNSRIRTTRAAVSLFTEPVITQIMGIPRQVPSNIGQFVQDQVKHCAVLPGNNVASDFCGVAGVGSEANPASRLLVVAADGRKVDEIVKVCSQAGLTVEVIEPPLLAYTRALYVKKIAGKFDSNVLIAILEGNNLSLCVFRKQTMDFVRTKSISKVPGTPYGEKTQPEEICQWLAEQINTVIQFYDVDVPDSSGKWEITVVADCVQLPENAEGALRAKVANASLQIMTGEDICQAAVVSQPCGPADCRQTDKPSPVAIGLAMKLLDTDTRNLGVNLLPPEVNRLRTTQKGALITANIAAAVLLFMILAILVPDWKIKNLNKSIGSKNVNLLQDSHTLFGKRASVNEQIAAVSNQINQINGILGSHRDTDWPGLLSDIGKAIPKTACITSLSSGASSGMFLKGLAMSNEAVYWFVDRLNKSERINSASIAETQRDSRGFISYEISCTMAPGKGK
jgi:hypothetical protein